MQVSCIIAYSLLRLITSDNHIASIMESMCVSTSPSIIGNPSCHHARWHHPSLITLHAARWQGMRLYYKATLARHRLRWQGISFSIGQQPRHRATPHSPTRARPNAETPLPRKTRFLCNAYIYPLPIKTPFFDYTPYYATPCSYADLCCMLTLIWNRFGSILKAGYCFR
jgi:hypothetical protein